MMPDPRCFYLITIRITITIITFYNTNSGFNSTLMKREIVPIGSEY